MENHSLSVNPASKIITGAFIGLCAGTVAIPRQYSLKKLLVQTPDYFEKTFNPTITKRMNEEQKGALSLLISGNETFRKSGKSQDRKIKSAAKKWHKSFNAIPIDADLNLRFQNKKEFLQRAIKETDFVNVNKNYRKIQSSLLESPDNLALREESLAITQKLKEIRSSLEFPIAQYKEVVQDIRKNRLKNMKSLPNSGLKIKTYFKKMEEEIGQKRTIKSNKLYELINTPLLKESYLKIQTFLPESRLGNAFKGAAVFGTLTALWLFFNPSTRT